MANDGIILKQSYVENTKGYKVSPQKKSAIQMLDKTGKDAKASFDKQLADDGWAGDLADGVSALWGSKNRASKVRKDLEIYQNNITQLQKAAKQGDEVFNKKFEQIYGVKYNQAAIDAYKKNPNDENYKKAFGTRQQDIQKRVSDYNKSQQTGATVVKTTAKIGAGVAIGVATGGTGLVALGVAAAGTAAVSALVEETDRAHLTGQHKNADGKTVKDKGTFRAGTDHGKILKDAAFDGAAVMAGGAVGKGAQIIAKGSKGLQISANIVGDVATGAVQEKLQTGEVTLTGTLMNAGMSGVGSAVSTGVLKDGIVKLKKGFNNIKSTKFSTSKSNLPKTMFDKDGNILVGGLFDNNNSSGGFWNKLKNKFSDLTPEERQLKAANQAKNKKALDLGLTQHVDSETSQNIISQMNAKGSNYSTDDAFIGQVVSDRLIDALEMENKGKTLIKRLAQNTPTEQISKQVQNGGVCSINGQLYVNDNGIAKQLRITPKQFEQLFPPMKLATMQQSGGTYICAATAQINGMLETPSGRAHLFSMLEASGDDIIVHLNNASVKFPGGKPIQLGKFMEHAPDGIQMIEQAFMTTNMKKASSVEITDIREFSTDRLAEQVKDIRNMRSPQDAANGLGFKGEKVWYQTHNQKIDLKKRQQYAVEKDNVREQLEKIMNDFVPGQDVMIAHWNHHQRTVVNYDPQTQIVTYRDPMSPGVDMQCTFNQFMNKGHSSYGLDVMLEKTLVEVPPTQAQKPEPIQTPKPAPAQTQAPKPTSINTFKPKVTELGHKPLVVATTADGNPIGASITNVNVILYKAGKRTAVPIPKDGTTIPVHESSTNTFLIIENKNGKISITTSESPDLTTLSTSASSTPKQSIQKDEIASAQTKPTTSIREKIPAKSEPLPIPKGAKYVDTINLFGKQCRRIQMPNGEYLTETKNGWRKL